MKVRYSQYICKSVPGLLLLFIALSCKTMPPVSNPLLDGGSFIPLEPGASTYILADVKGARPILNLIPIKELNEDQTRQILDRTQSAAAALYPGESGRRFQLAAWGDFPSGGAGMAFGLSRQWKKVRSAGGYSYWYSGANNLSVAMNAKQVHVAASSAGMPVEPVSPGPPLQSPDDFVRLNRGAVLSCWLLDPDAAVMKIFEAMELPLQLPAEQMFISLYPHENAEAQILYRAAVRIEASGESQARALTTLFSMARVFSLQPAETEGPASLAARLFANTPVQDGRYVDITTAPLSEKDISLLLSFFSIP